jgi:hypothetical protein
MAFIQSCPKCGMSRGDWQGEGGQGYAKDRETYCRRGCAEGTGCTCRTEDQNKAAFTNAG